MQTNYTTERLQLNLLSADDHAFILELLNTPEWIRFIGDRNIHNREDAETYIQKIISNPDINYWIVKLKEDLLPVGIISFIKRENLPHHDIGFAFLQRHTKKGYAYEAVNAVLNDVTNDPAFTEIMATTIKENEQSIKLLEKLGLQFLHETKTEQGETLLVYSASTAKLSITRITQQFFSVFSNTDGKIPNWELLRKICIPEIIIIKKTGSAESVDTLESFIEPRKKILSGGTITAFKENETAETTTIIGNIAQRSAAYQKSGLHDGIPFSGNGHKLFQFIRTATGWKISAMVWEDEE